MSENDSPFSTLIKMEHEVAQTTNSFFSDHIRTIIRVYENLYVMVENLAPLSLSEDFFNDKLSVFLGFYARIINRTGPTLSMLERGFYPETKLLLRSTFEDLEYIIFCNHYPNEIINILKNEKKYTAGYIFKRISKNFSETDAFHYLYKSLSKYVHFSLRSFKSIYDINNKKIFILPRFIEEECSDILYDLQGIYMVLLGLVEDFYEVFPQENRMDINELLSELSYNITKLKEMNN